MNVNDQYIIRQLEAVEKNIPKFVDKVINLYNNYPFIMTRSMEVRDYLTSLPMLQNGNTFEDMVAITLMVDSSQMNKGVTLLLNGLFSTLGKIIESEDFWIPLVSKKPHYAKYYSFDSRVIESLAAIVK